MENKNKGVGVWPLMGMISAALYVLLLLGKAIGIVKISWSAAFLSFIWIAAMVLIAGMFMVLAVALTVEVVKVRRERKVDRRIRAQAKALGLWDKPSALGGRCLEMSARENFGIRRKPGETDRELRARCMAQADEQLAESPWEGSATYE